MNENTSTCVKCGHTLAQHDYVHGTRGNCGNFIAPEPETNDITQLSTLYSNAIARAEKAEEALRGWQPIETAPKDGTTIILFCPQGDGTPGSTFRLTSGSWFIPPSYGTISDPEVDEQEPPAWLSWDGGFSEETMMPTHWQPLPSPPPRGSP